MTANEAFIGLRTGFFPECTITVTAFTKVAVIRGYKLSSDDPVSPCMPMTDMWRKRYGLGPDTIMPKIQYREDAWLK